MIATLGRIAVIGGFLGGAWALGGSGCVRDVDDHCANLSGDASCRGYYGKADTRRDFCSSCESAFHGCVEAPPMDDACWAKGGKPTDPPADDTGTTGGSGSGSESSDTGGDDLPVATGDASSSGSGSESGDPPPECGNGIKEGDEDCDGEDLGGADCGIFGRGGGELACRSDCVYETMGCMAFEGCGDEVIQPPEECDGTNLNGESCATLEDQRVGGNLTCANCVFNVTACCIPNGDSCVNASDCCSGICMGAIGTPLIKTCRAAR